MKLRWGHPLEVAGTAKKGTARHYGVTHRRVFVGFYRLPSRNQLQPVVPRRATKEENKTHD